MMLALEKGESGTYHFSVSDGQTVADVVEQTCTWMGFEFRTCTRVVGERLGQDAGYRLDCSKAHMKLNWYPRWDLSETLLRIVEWHKLKDAHNNYRKLCLTQINDYMKDMNNENC